MSKKIRTFENFDLNNLRPIIESCGGGSISSCGGGSRHANISSCGGSSISSCGGYSSAPTRSESEEDRIRKKIAKRRAKLEIVTNMCDNCQADLVKGAKFCHECGSKV